MSKRAARTDADRGYLAMAKSIKLLAASITRVNAIEVAVATFEEHYSNRGYSATTKLAFFKYLAGPASFATIFNTATADVRDAMVDEFWADVQRKGVI